MGDYEAQAVQLYDCLKDAQEKGAWYNSQLAIIAAALKEAVAAEREECAKVAGQAPLRSPVAAQRDKIAAAIRDRKERPGIPMGDFWTEKLLGLDTALITTLPTDR